MKKLAMAAAAVAAVAALAAGTLGASAQEDARVRVVHASPDAPNVDVYADGTEVLSDVPFGTASDYLEVPAGDYNFQVFAAGADPATDDPVIDADATLAAGTDYTVVALGLVAEITAGVFVDNNAAPAAGKAHVRVIHASPDAPNVDVAVADGPVVFADVPFGEAAGPTPVDAGSYDLEVRAAGTDTVALPLSDVAFADGSIYTVIAIGLLNGDPELSALTLVDEPRSAPAPSATATPGTTAPPAGTPVAPPATGAGPGGSDGLNLAWLLAGAALVVGAGAVTLATAARRND